MQCHDGQRAHFEAYGNRIALIREAEYLRGLPMLAEVVLRRHGQDNPVCREPGYREKVLTLLPGLQTIDDESTTGTAPVPDRPGAAYACALEALSQPMPSASAAGVGGAGTATAHSGSQGPGSAATMAPPPVGSAAAVCLAAAAASAAPGGCSGGAGGALPLSAAAAAATTSVPPTVSPSDALHIVAEALRPIATPHIDATLQAVQSRRQAAARVAAAAATAHAPLVGARHAGGVPTPLTAAPPPLAERRQDAVPWEYDASASAAPPRGTLYDNTIGTQIKRSW